MSNVSNVSNVSNMSNVSNVSNMSNADYFAQNLEDVESEEIYTLQLSKKFNTITKKHKIVYNDEKILPYLKAIIGETDIKL